VRFAVTKRVNPPLLLSVADFCCFRDFGCVCNDDYLLLSLKTSKSVGCSVKFLSRNIAFSIGVPPWVVVPCQSGGSDSSSAVMVWTRKSRGG
jgi:hypothetical protein